MKPNRLLSTDPLMHSYPWYTPYQFTGNNPIVNIDLDGEEPQDYKDNWIPKSISAASTSQVLGMNGILIYDPKLGKKIDVDLVYDRWTKQVIKDFSNEIFNNYVKAMVSMHQKKEMGASHIGNIILSELINSGNTNFTGLNLQEKYFGGLSYKTEFQNGKMLLIPEVIDYDLLRAPRTKEYYLNTKFDIYEEHGIQKSDN